MRQRPLEYTVKIYCEGFTEWYYFEWLRTNSRFSFSLEPGVPKNSRSSYKQNLKLIEQDLRKDSQERADTIFLVIDTDTLARNKSQLTKYQETKKTYEKRGVVFIESHPCIELWFLYHLIDKFAKTNYETYAALRPAIEEVLPKYEKTARYYRKSGEFHNNILSNTGNREKAVGFSIKACEYKPVEGEVVNYTETFKTIRLFHLLQKFAEIRLLLNEMLRSTVAVRPIVNGCGSLSVVYEDTTICTLKYDKTRLVCAVASGQQFEIDGAKPLNVKDTVMASIAATLK